MIEVTCPYCGETHLEENPVKMTSDEQHKFAQVWNVRYESGKRL